MENENLIGVYLKLLSVLECPVCLDYLTKPVALCNEGHALCSKCKSNISSCPMCRNPISSTRGLILDQIIETLLYPCYKMGCGSLLKRRDAENHDLNCTLENATDKQAVLHNNLLKNIEENFASFIVQPEIVKETRTVATITGKVKTADVLVQTAIPFSQVMEKSMSAGYSSNLTGLPKAGPTSGISISSMELSPNTGVKTVDFSNFSVPFPQKSSFTFSMNPDMWNMYSFPQDSSFKSSVDPFNNVNAISKNTALFNSNANPFTFTSSRENNLENTSRNISKKPSTNLNFAMENSSSSSHGCSEAGPSFFTGNHDVPSVQGLASTSSSTGLDLKKSKPDSNFENNNPQNKPGSSFNSCGTLLNNACSVSSQPFVSNNSLTATAPRKRPTTNLCGLTSRA